MPRLRAVTEQIWLCSPNGEIGTRKGRITLDGDEKIADFEDAHRPLHVDGLYALDFAVYLHFSGKRNFPKDSIGYLVSEVSDSHEGIIVPGNSVEARPNLWMNDRLGDMIQYLGEEAMADFGLASLHRYVQSERSSQRNS